MVTCLIPSKIKDTITNLGRCLVTNFLFHKLIKVIFGHNFCYVHHRWNPEKTKRTHASEYLATKPDFKITQIPVFELTTY